MKKALRKLVPAIVMLLIAAAFVGTSTYAWFSMNRIVNVSGMSVTTKVTDSLLIAESNAEANYGTSLTQSRVGKLRPVSTVNGVDFFYTASSNVTGNGAARSASYTAYSEAANAAENPTNVAPTTQANPAPGKAYYDADFNEAYGIASPAADTVLYGYIDYVFYIKATNVSGSDEALKLTKLNLLYGGATVTEKAWRVAVFAQDAAANTDLDTALVASDCKAILTLSGATNYDAGKAAKTTSSRDTVTYTSAAWSVATVGTGVNATAYYKITVRLWLEGEDNTCNNETFASLTSAYTLAIEFRLGGSEAADAAVTAIGSVAA